METNLKKLLPIVGIMLTSLNLVHADDLDVSYSSSSKTSTKVNPPANQPSDNAYGAFTWADYLYWVVNEQSPVAVSGIYTAGTTTPEVGSVLYPDFKGLSGFDVGIGMTVDHDNWDIYLGYTWLQQNNSSLKNLYSSAQGSSTAYGVYTPVGDLVDEVNSYWKYQYNNLDLDAGRDFFVGHYFTLRPHAGFKFAWTTKTLDATYILDSNQHLLTANNHQKFWGVGPRAGVDPTFYLSDNWQFFATTAAALPWSQVKVTQTLTDNTNETAVTYRDFKDQFYIVAPVLESGFGLRWKAMFGDDNAYGFAVSAKWDAQVWFNQDNWTSANGDIASVKGAPLTQQGLTVGIRFDF